jgi:Fe-S cluster biogenesis protein NfuA
MEMEAKLRLMQQVEGALDSIRTFLRADGGDVELLDVEDNMNVKLKLLGQCRSCSMSAMTMKAGIEDAIRRAVPEIQSVESVQDND